MEIIPSLSVKQRGPPLTDYMVSFRLIVYCSLIKPLIHISRFTLLSNPYLRSPIGTSPSHIGTSRSSLIGISRIYHSSPIGTSRSSPIETSRSSPIGISQTPSFRLCALIQHLCSRCSLQSRRTSAPSLHSILIGGASYFNITPIHNFLNSSQELLPMELGQDTRAHFYG